MRGVTALTQPTSDASELAPNTIPRKVYAIYKLGTSIISYPYRGSVVLRNNSRLCA